jgi:hypothetical protein
LRGAAVVKAGLAWDTQASIFMGLSLLQFANTFGSINLQPVSETGRKEAPRDVGRLEERWFFPECREGRVT